MKSSRC